VAQRKDMSACADMIERNLIFREGEFCRVEWAHLGCSAELDKGFLAGWGE